MAEATTQTAPVDTGRLKYADPRSLPSFPSIGLRPDGAAAGAAATLGWNNPKTVELWKPDKLSSASAAAVLAKDYKMPPLWTPSANPTGHKAALLAVDSASSALKQQPSTSVPRSQHEGWGNSAATQAFLASRTSSIHIQGSDTSATQAYTINRSQSVQKARVSSPALGDRSLAAAKGAMASSRPRATSTPLSPQAAEPQLQSTATSNALTGATTAHRASMKSKPYNEDAGAVPITTMTRNMFTSHPMLKPEVDEQQTTERLHQSAVEMAKKMYNQQQKMMDQARERGEDPDSVYNSPYLNLQDAAYKQAQERLEKLKDEHQMTREMQEYYGQARAPRRRLSVASRLRRKSSDDGLYNDRDESERIRQQMSIFSNRLSAVDKAKRQHDRDALLAVAQRNVKSQLHGIDEKVYQDTGKVNPSLLSDWEAKAHHAAQTRHEARDEHGATLNLGGGMFMEQEKIDAIAAQRMQPILDDINEKAEEERERVAAQKMDEEDRKAEREREKEHARGMKAIMKRVREEDKEDEKEWKRKDKEDEKARKEQEKAEKAEKKRLEKERRKSKRDSAASDMVAEDIHEHDQTRDAAETGESRPAAGLGAAGLGAAEEGRAPADVDEAAAEAEQDQGAEGPASHRSRVKGWVRNRFSRAWSVGEQGGKEPETTGKGEKPRGLFRGGGLLKRNTERNASQTSPEHHSSSMRDVALAGKAEEQETADEAGPAGLSSRRDSGAVRPEEPETADEARPVGLSSRRDSGAVRPEEPETADEARPAGLSSYRDPEVVSHGEQETADKAEPGGLGSRRDSGRVSPGEQETPDKAEPVGLGARQDSQGVSPVSSGEDKLRPPRPIEDPEPRSSASPSRDSRFREEIEM